MFPMWAKILIPLLGLPFLCGLLFCHRAEMRVSKDGCEYSGALLGLGPNPQANPYSDGGGMPSLFPDEDIELCFDVPIDNDDLDVINKVC